MSIKNLLQQFCHENSLEEPKYRFISDMMTDDNTHTFVSECTVKIGGKSFTFVGEGPRKKESEKSAAQNCYNALVYNDVREQNIPYKAPHEPEKIVLIDVENIPHAVTNVIWPAKWLVVTCISKYSHHYKTLSKLQSMSCVQVIDSSNRDAADIELIFLAGRLSTSFGGEFLFVTSDHYGHPLIQCMKDCGRHATTLTSLRDIEDKIEN